MPCTVRVSLRRGTPHGSRTTRFFSDELGRTTNILHANGAVARFAYGPGGQLTNHIDVAGRLTRFTYLPMNTLASVSRGGATATNTIAMAYDDRFNTLNITDPRYPASTAARSPSPSATWGCPPPFAMRTTSTP